MSKKCVLCHRETKRGTTEHHLIPRTLHSNKWFKRRYTREEMQRTVALCLDCHRAVHDFIPSAKELGRDFNTVAALLAHPEIDRFVAWVAKQK